ncbi:hypothetical protein [Streptomyces sp. NPDC001642]|uniref:Uncharacterized protein n=1 Tax=Streptomyces sp. R08 TaxID=3238624 RepID=A0AB39MD19_9ACTN
MLVRPRTGTHGGPGRDEEEASVVSSSAAVVELHAAEEVDAFLFSQ